MKIIRYIEYIINKHRIKRNLKQVLKEVKLHQEGKLELKTWQEVLNEMNVDKTIKTSFRFKKLLKKLSKS